MEGAGLPFDGVLADFFDTMGRWSASVTALTESEECAETTGRVERKIAGIDFHDLAIGLSTALTIMIMPSAFSITEGIGFGFIAYVVIRIAQGDWQRVHPLMNAAAGAFTLYFLMPLLHDNLSWI